MEQIADLLFITSIIVIVKYLIIFQLTLLKTSKITVY